MTSPTDQQLTYRVEFDPNGNLFNIPELTLDFTTHDEFVKAVTEHAIPHLTPVLASMDRPELADCVFHPVADMSGGHFLWLDFQSGNGARFCPTRLTPVPAEETHVVADDSDDPEHVDDCPGCETAPAVRPAAR